MCQAEGSFQGKKSFQFSILIDTLSCGKVYVCCRLSIRTTSVSPIDYNLKSFGKCFRFYAYSMMIDSLTHLQS